jgi:predicted nucleic acid-binding Zn ribbon protein
MIQYVHIVQVHPVENGEPNLHKVVKEMEFGEKWQAETCVEWLNHDYQRHNPTRLAVYLGRVNDATGELE